MGFIEWFFKWKKRNLSYKLFIMKRTILILIVFGLFNVLNAQQSFKAWVSFYKVDESSRSDYEVMMKDYFGEIMTERVKNGCMQNWVFLSVDQNSPMAEKFTHITVDVLMPGSENYSCDAVTLNSVFPNLPQSAHSMMAKMRNQSRNVVYRTRVESIVGDNSLDKTPQKMVWNFTRALSPLYKMKHMEHPELIQKYYNADAWFAFERTESVAYASSEWNYLTVDGFENSEKMNLPAKPLPSKVQNQIDKKYGPAEKQRDITHRIITTTLFASADQ